MSDISPHFVFVYPQIQRITGAQRLILALAKAVSVHARVTILTHHITEQCRAILDSQVGLIESGRKLNFSSNHYLNSINEYLAVPSLLPLLPKDVSTICFFGPPSLPGLWFAKNIRRLKIPLWYFCYEPPRAAYTDRREVSRRMGKLGGIMQAAFWAYRPLDRYLARQADRFLVNSEYAKQIISQTYGKNATIITHGVDLPLSPDLAARASQLRHQLGLPENQPIVLSVNHLHPRKRLDLLLQAWQLVVQAQPQASLILVGRGPEQTSLMDLAANLGLTKTQVIFAEFVPESELAVYYTAANIYAHTGRDESFGLSVLEASYFGLPVVAVDEGGPREILQDGETGFLVEANPASLAAKISLLINDTKQRAIMGQANATRVQAKYTWEQGALAFLKLD